MKANRFFSLAASVGCAVAALFSLSSCSSFDEPGTGVSIRLNASVVGSEYSTSDLSASSPFHVIAYTREKQCKPWYVLFEDDAYIDSKGNVTWTSGRHEWPQSYMMFVAYWPATSVFEFDPEGSVSYTDCQLFAMTDAVYFDNPNITLYFGHLSSDSDW